LKNQYPIILKTSPLPKKILFYASAFALLALNFLFFNGAYQELIRYTELTGRSNTVRSSYQNLSRYIINASVFNPDLIKASNSSKVVKLFDTESQSVIQQLRFLKSTVIDSINIQNIEKLDTEIKFELSWILKKSTVNYYTF
jgi:hypothetical protein